MALFQNLVCCLHRQILSEGPTTLVKFCTKQKSYTEVTFKPNIFHMKFQIPWIEIDLIL